MRSVLVVAAVLAIASTAGARQLQTPSDWKWRTDSPAALAPGPVPAPGGWSFVAMPPGWHITTGPGALLFPVGPGGPGARRAEGTFALQAEVFLFPGTSQEEYGVFIGGQSIDPAAGAPQYVAFVARRDGHAAVIRAGASREIVGGWMANEAVLPHDGGTGTVKNILRVEVGAAEIVFSANGKEIRKLPRAGIQTDGTFGFRVGRDVNLHVSTLDLTLRLAPQPPKK